MQNLGGVAHARARSAVRHGGYDGDVPHVHLPQQAGQLLLVPVVPETQTIIPSDYFRILNY